MLSCSCPETDGPGCWWCFPSDDFIRLDTKRRQRCSSCNELINVGDECLKFERERAAYDELEEEERGSEIAMAPLWMCEKCGEIFLNLDDAGYCLNPTDDMRDVLAEYHELTGFTPARTG